MKDIGAHDCQFAMGEIDNTGRLVDDDDSGREQRVRAAQRKNADQQFHGELALYYFTGNSRSVFLSQSPTPTNLSFSQ